MAARKVAEPRSGSATSLELVVLGSGGLLDGVRRTLAPGEALVVGRSRSCHVSLRKTRAFRRHPAPEKVIGSREFNRISRIHCEIEYLAEGKVEVRDLSRNGTVVDGVRVGRSMVVRLDGRRVVVELVDGTWGKLLLDEIRPIAGAADAPRVG